jgi:hypothetical protein
VTGADLLAEYLGALRSTSWADLEPLRAAGVGGPGIALAPAWARIRVSRGLLYEPDPDGGAACIVPVRGDPLSPEALDPVETIQNGPLLDLLALDPQFPSRWALRRGSAEWAGAIDPQYMPPCKSVRVWRTPLAWLRAGHGLVLLSPFHGPGHRILTLCDSLVAEDHDHARQLRAALEHPWPIPAIRVGRETTRRAA